MSLEARYQNGHDSKINLSFSFPFFDGGGPRRLGELAIAAAEPRDDNLRADEPFGWVLGKPRLVGVVGIEDILLRSGAAACVGDSPEAASVKRNSTHSREKD